MKTVGILREVPEKKLWEIGVPVGVIAAIIPSTNPTSTVCYKAMTALKSGNAIVFSPHPKAIACTRKAAQIVSEAAQAAGAPADAVACLSIPSLDGCQELMKAEPVQRGSRHRRPGYGEGGVFFRQARHRCRRGKRPCLYPPQRGCRPCSGLYRKVKVL